MSGYDDEIDSFLGGEVGQGLGSSPDQNFRFHAPSLGPGTTCNFIKVFLRSGLPLFDPLPIFLSPVAGYNKPCLGSVDRAPPRYWCVTSVT